MNAIETIRRQNLRAAALAAEEKQSPMQMAPQELEAIAPEDIIDRLPHVYGTGVADGWVETEELWVDLRKQETDDVVLIGLAELKQRLDDKLAYAVHRLASDFAHIGVYRRAVA